MLRKYFSLFAVLFFFLPCLSQKRSEIALFNAYYQKSIEELRSLYGIRQSVFKCEPVADPFESVKSFLKVYGDKKKKVGVIFYSVDSLYLRTWLIKNDQLFFSEQPSTKVILKKIETDIRDALQVDMLLAAGDSVQRGLIIKKGSKKTDLNIAIRNATDLLMPEPIASQLRGLEHLILITEYNIGQIPLYLLKPFKNDSYLIDSISLSLAPHLCNLGNIAGMNKDVMGKPNKLIAKNPLIVGNPVYANSGDLHFDRLPGAGAEATSISKWTEGTLLTDSAATISAVRSFARNADLLYFATHGYSDVEKVLDGSYLVFGPDSSSSTGLWTARQIQEENFTGKQMMAILSACQTGVGKVYDAGFIGLGRAFFKAGVDHTIMSLWSVNDKATSTLMKKFVMKMLVKPLDFYPASHLREAILEFKKEQPEPAFWAPFILFGFPY